MQLKNKKIGASIAAAASGLLGAAAVPPAVAAAPDAKVDNWTVDSALIYYGESDSRVKDASLKSIITWAVDEDRILNINASLDVLTGASPTGAVPTDSVQTFTRPSGNDQYQVAAGELPLDDTFKDTRLALAANWQQPVGELSRINFGVSASKEYDYLHLGANARFERDFNLRNTTVFAGLAYSSDSIEPEGGIPTPFSAMQTVGTQTNKNGDDDKTIIDGLIGVTQILSRRSLVSVSYAYSLQDGYLNDPFKLVSVVDPVTGRPLAGSSPELGLHLFEKRPDSRAKQSLFGEWRYALDRDSLAVSLRLMTDDWGVDSTTLEGRYRFNFAGHRYFEPQLRFYQQSAADFYRSYLLAGQALPDYASADYRLAKMTAVTVGGKYGWRTRAGEWSVRLEYYRQDTKSDDPKFGVLANYDLVPPLSAVIVQLGYKFGF